ncbi:MAG: phosphotransferase [Ruminococcus sp.]|nr:phosphotransferase [Ruminococcus sp.]
MNSDIISAIFFSCINKMPQETERCAIGIGNYVYIVKCDDIKYIIRCSEDNNAYDDTIYWLKKLSALDIPVPKVLFCGQYQKYSYLILNYIEGKDIGLVYRDLTEAEKREIAKEVIKIQRKVSRLPLENNNDEWSWVHFIDDMLERADKLIVQNGYFDSQKVKQLKEQKAFLEEYFADVKPVAYLDDISTKNLLIHHGRISGIIDIDWIGIGDDLTFIALTYVALLDMEYETDYVEYLLNERGCNASEMKAFCFYSLLFCVDFMGERGTQFGDKKIEVSEKIIKRFDQIYEMLWKKWCKQICKQ